MTSTILEKATKNQVLYLLDEGYSDGPALMYHGTSLDSVVQMFMTGRTFPSRRAEKEDHPINEGYMFFFPRREMFKGHLLYDSINDRPERFLEDEAVSYARKNEGNEEFRRFFTDAPEDLDSPVYVRGIRGIPDLLKWDEGDLETNANKRRWVEKNNNRVIQALKDKNGVVIGISRKAITLPIENGCDTPGEEVMIKIEGIPLSIVQYIMPCGEREERILREFAETLE